MCGYTLSGHHTANPVPCDFQQLNLCSGLILPDLANYC